MEMYDPTGVPDVFASGLGKIEKLSSGIVRLTFYVEETRPDGSIEHRVVARILRDRASLGNSIMAIAHLIAEEPLMADRGKIHALQ